MTLLLVLLPLAGDSTAVLLPAQLHYQHLLSNLLYFLCQLLPDCVSVITHFELGVWWGNCTINFKFMEVCWACVLLNVCNAGVPWHYSLAACPPASSVVNAISGHNNYISTASTTPPASNPNCPRAIYLVRSPASSSPPQAVPPQLLPGVPAHCPWWRRLGELAGPWTGKTCPALTAHLFVFVKGGGKGLGGRYGEDKHVRGICKLKVQTLTPHTVWLASQAPALVL